MRVQPKQVGPDRQKDNTDKDQEEKLLLRGILANKSVKVESGGDFHDAPFTSSTDQLLARMKNLMEIKFRAELEDKDAKAKDDELIGDWMAASLILDRFFLIFSATCLVVGSVILFCLVLGF